MKKPIDKTIKFFLKLKYGERGATAVEYALMAALIAAVIITSVATLGSSVVDLFNTVIIP